MGSNLFRSFPSSSLCRELAGFCSDGYVAKLFSRHMKVRGCCPIDHLHETYSLRFLKVEEQAVFLSSHPTPLAIATPNRLQKLLEESQSSERERDRERERHRERQRDRRERETERD